MSVIVQVKYNDKVKMMLSLKKRTVMVHRGN